MARRRSSTPRQADSFGISARGLRHVVARVFPDGERIATGVSHAVGSPVVVWNASDGRVIHSLRNPPNARICFMELSPCGKMLVTAAAMAVTSVWDAASGRLLRELPGASLHLATGLAVSADAAVVATSTTGGKIFLWDGRSGRLRRTLMVRGGIATFALFAGGRRIVVASETAALVHDTGDGEVLHELDGASGELQRIAVSPDGEVVAACGAAPRWWGGMRTGIWNGSTGQRLYTITGEDSDMGVFYFGPSLPCSVDVGPTGSLSGWLAL